MSNRQTDTLQCPIDDVDDGCNPALGEETSPLPVGFGNPALGEETSPLRR